MGFFLSKENEKTEIVDGGVGTPREVVKQINEYLLHESPNETVIIVVDSLRRKNTSKKVKMWKRIRRIDPQNT